MMQDIQNKNQDSFELMSFKFPTEFCKSLRFLKQKYNKDMSLIIIESVTSYVGSDKLKLNGDNR